MFAAILTALVSLSVGAALALGPWAVRLGRMHFVSAALAVVVVIHLLPDAVKNGGFSVLIATAVSLGTVIVLERLSHARGRVGEVGLELGFAGVCLHKLGDGLLLGQATHMGMSGLATFSAVALHTVPMAALITVAYLPRGARVAFSRILMLAAFAVSGVILASFIEHRFEQWEPWLNAVTAGLLLHLVVHRHPMQRDEDGECCAS